MHDRTTTSPLFTQVDISPSALTSTTTNGEHEQTRLLREILTAQDRQNELLEELINQLTAPQKQRNQELGQWKSANPDLAQHCRVAAETLSRVQTEFLNTLTQEVNDNAEVLCDGEFMLNEFVDRFGPRLAHLNGVLQVLAQLGAPASS
ncbi:MAG TPA: hypothetical protein VG125_09035 [Pirellulales bacterium]|jgi:hypothetical protein|nr:hypothetical protein [Pirellulales bacterium]